MLSNPIFIIGTERSGSNLLRLLLNAHSQIAIPHPPHVMRDLAPMVDLYGNLQEVENFQALAEDMATLVNMHFAPWPVKVWAGELTKRAPSQTLYGLYLALYEIYRDHAGKPRWGCKSTFMYQQIDSVLAHHAQPRFLHLVRDPRDVATSAGESIFSKFHPFKQAELWTNQQSEIENWRPRLNHEKYLRVRYEDLVGSPESTVHLVMEFLGEEFEPAQMQYFKTNEASGLAELSESWKNVREPVSTKSVGRYRRDLTPQDVALVEHHTWDLMQEYGYAAEHERRPRGPDYLMRLRIESEERLKKVSAESRALFQDRNFVLRWKRWAFLQFVKGKRSLIYG